MHVLRSTNRVAIYSELILQAVQMLKKIKIRPFSGSRCWVAAKVLQKNYRVNWKIVHVVYQQVRLWV